MGLTCRAYRRTGSHECLGELLQACRAFRQPPAEIVDTTTFLETVSWTVEFDEFLTRQSTTWARQVGYLHDFLRRKFVLGQLSSSPGCTNVEWSEVSAENLRQLSPDVCEYLSRVPGTSGPRATLSAADLSRFCLDRDDWGIFVPMWACLWGAVVKAKTYKCEDQRMRAALIALVASDEFLQAAQEHFHRYGAAAHVLMLVRQFGPVDTWPVQKGLGKRPCTLASSQGHERLE